MSPAILWEMSPVSLDDLALPASDFNLLSDLAADDAIDATNPTVHCMPPSSAQLFVWFAPAVATHPAWEVEILPQPGKSSVRSPGRGSPPKGNRQTKPAASSWNGSDSP